MLNLRDFKMQLLGQVDDWIHLIKDHLKVGVTERLEELEKFVANGRKILSLEISKDDYETLLKIMEVLAEIKDRRQKYNAIFQPLTDIVELLKLYGEEFDEEIYAKVFLDPS